MGIQVFGLVRSTLLFWPLLAAVSTAGCGLSGLTRRDTNPVIQDFAQWVPFANRQQTNIFATTASRRIAVVTQSAEGAVEVCAEPSPDVGEAFASALSAQASATGLATPEVSGDLSATYGRTASTQISPLIYRSQGLQLYRDLIYKLCIDRLNGWVTNEQYLAARDDALKQIIPLIEKELPVMGGVAEHAFARDPIGSAVPVQPEPPEAP